MADSKIEALTFNGQTVHVEVREVYGAAPPSGGALRRGYEQTATPSA